MPDATVVRMGPEGEIVVPLRLRRVLGLDEGSTMTATIEHGRLILESRSVALERLRHRFSVVPMSTRLTDELLADRRKNSGGAPETT